MLSLSVLVDWSQATHEMTSVFGVPLIVHRHESDEVISGSLMRDGFWEFAESMLLLALVRPGMTLLDVGANIGYYTAVLARLVGKQGILYAFEPDPDNFKVLAANVTLLSRLLPEPAPVHFLQTALSDRVGIANLKRFSKNLGLHHLIADSQASPNCIPVDTTTIDHLRGMNIIGRRIDLIKADIQGSELAMLRGAQQTIQTDHPTLVLEFEPHMNGMQMCFDLLDWLRSNGYNQVRLFKSNRCDPAILLKELARTLSIDEASDALRQNRIGPYGTIFASWVESH